MLVTRNFSVGEFAQPARHGFEAEPYPEKWIVSRLTALCNALEIVREALGGHPIAILSGYRSEEYNRAIGGAPESQHVQGRAADIVVKNLSPANVHRHVLALHRLKLIKLGGLGLYPKFVHVDIRPGDRLARWTGSRRET